ncbi:hypothetical protein [Corynebacterium nuruki]|jgi:hypothetical protein|nr:hypothetical protein [Corynebacterium nuruki]
MNTSHVFQRQLRHAQQRQLSTGRAGTTLCADLPCAGYQPERPAHRI